MSSFTVNRFVCPALAIATAIVALWGPWFTRTTSVTKNVIDSTLLEILRGRGIVEFTSTRWIWLWGVGVVLVVVSAALGTAARKRLAQGGAYLMIILPGWSLFNVFADDSNVDAGWALYVVAGLTVAIILLANRLPEEEPAPFVADLDQPTIG